MPTNSTYKDYVYDLTDEQFMQNIEPSVLTGVTVDGRVIGYPFLVQSHSFIYNKALFRELGIGAPETISELEATAKKLEAAGCPAVRYRVQGILGASSDRMADSCSLCRQLWRLRGVCERSQ